MSQNFIHILYSSFWDVAYRNIWISAVPRIPINSIVYFSDFSIQNSFGAFVSVNPFFINVQLLVISHCKDREFSSYSISYHIKWNIYFFWFAFIRYQMSVLFCLCLSVIFSEKPAEIGIFQNGIYCSWKRFNLF